MFLSDGTDDDLIVLRSGSVAACIDLGNPDGTLPMLSSELRSDRISELDRYVFSSYDKGATERFSDVLSSVYVRRVILTRPTDAEKQEFDELTSQLDRLSVGYEIVSDKFDLYGYALQFRKAEPYEDAPTAPLMLSIKAKDARLLYIGENVPITSVDDLFPDGVTAIFLGSHGETPYLSFTLDLPKTVKTVYTGSEFYKTCLFRGGSDDLRLFCRKRLVPDGFAP